MIYEGTLHVGVADNAKIEKLYTASYCRRDGRINIKTVYGNGCYATAEAALKEIENTDVDFEQAMVSENVFADKLLIAVHLIKYAYKNKAISKQWM
jgi:hypothetical protein